MALSDPLSISPTAPTAGTGSEVSLVVIKTEPQGSTRLNETTDLSNPEQLVIKHSQSGTEKGGNIVDRHLISLSRVERDDDNVAHTCTVNLTIAVPRNGLFSSTEVKRQIDMIANFFQGTGVVTKILQNQS